MRVLHVMPDGGLGGGASHLLTLLPALREAGVTCVAAVGGGPLGDALRALAFRVEPLELRGFRADPRSIAALARVCRALGVDVVHHHGVRAGFFGAFTRTLPGARPSVCTLHHLAHMRTDLPRTRRALHFAGELIACRAADAVIAVSRTFAQTAHRHFGVPPARCFHIPNPLDTGRFAGRSRDAARALLGLPHHARVIGTVARLVPEKGVDVLLRAAARVPDCTVVVVGDGVDRPRLEGLARELRIDTRFVGYQVDTARVLAAFDVFALASRWEADGIVLCEALAAGVPCVATATSGAIETLGGGAGALVPLGDVSALGTALAAALEAGAKMGGTDQGSHTLAKRAPTVVAAQTHAVYRGLV